MIKFPTKMKERIDKGCCGAGVGQGWMPLVIALDEELSTHCPDYVIEQIKEKFGGLRYYTSGVDIETQELIANAEDKSYSICETCGEVGKLRKGGWLKTACDKHSKYQG